MKSTFKYSDIYKDATDVQKAFIDILDDSLYDVQYAKPGERTEKRREFAELLLTAIEGYYIAK